MGETASSLLELRATTAGHRGVEATLTAVFDVANGAPALVHLGRPVATDSALEALTVPVLPASAASTGPLSTLPEHGSGCPARPGLLGRRPGGRAWAPRFALEAVDRIDDATVRVITVDPVAELQLTTTVHLDHALSVAHELCNLGSSRYAVEHLAVTIGLPDSIAELMTFSGRWADEFRADRRPWAPGGWSVENRRGRSSHESPPMVVAGTPGFGEWAGEVWIAHLAWSADHRIGAEQLPDGRRSLQLGELLHPGALVLEPGDTVRTPEVLVSWSDRGLTPASWGLHRTLRAVPGWSDRSRPVLINTWEACYFDLDEERLRQLATTAARIGVERFVLDDGWFADRRDDQRSLGDWYVRAEVFPDGLEPFIDHVERLGMEFGLWVEPEMVNPDSELFRAHPDWVLSTEGYEPVQIRSQLVLDLARPEVYDHVFQAIDRLLRTHRIAFLKWDMNRELVQASGSDGAPASHAQTRAVWALMDQLIEAHPGLQIESCASGGGRVDLGILQRTYRVWISDNNDPADRQRIQHGASVLLPPEAMGAHIGPERAHTTGRTQSLSFRAATAMFGHLGLELDLAALDAAELDQLAEVIAIHRRFRPLLHGGDAVRFDLPPPWFARGVYAADRSEALLSIALVDTPAVPVAPMVRLPELDLDRRYAIRHVPMPAERWGLAYAHPRWTDASRSEDGFVTTGAMLERVGLRPPVLLPGSAALFHLRAMP